MSSEAGIVARGTAVARPPRLARWLAWCIRMLVLWPLIALWFFMVDFVQVKVQPEYFDRFLLSYVPFVLAWLCLTAAGLALRYWRRAMGLQLACLLIWLAPLISICDSLIKQPPSHGLAISSMRLALLVLQSGTLHAVGFTAFLLGNPRLRDAYGLHLTGFEPQAAAGGIEEGEGGQFRPPAWLIAFCCFLLSPLLLLVPMLSQHHILYDLYWQAHPFGWQLACLAFVAPPVFLAIGLVKYRYAYWLNAAMLLLVSYSLLAVLPDLASLPGWHVPAFDAIGKLPHLFGFEPLAAFAWAAYFRTAPDIRARYYGEPVAGVDIDVF